MDDTYRGVVKESLLKQDDILAVHFEKTPEVDFINVDEDH